MRATGIVRRIDELGRVVIPKEIRRTLRILEGDPLEIFTDHDGEVVLKKYSPIGEIASIAKDYTDSLYRTLGHMACICDRDAVIAIAGGARRELLEKAVSRSDYTAEPGEDLAFAALAAEFAMVLRDDENKGTASLEGILDSARKLDLAGDEYKEEFVSLVRLLWKKEQT